LLLMNKESKWKRMRLLSNKPANRKKGKTKKKNKSLPIRAPPRVVSGGEKDVEIITPLWGRWGAYIARMENRCHCEKKR